MIDYEMLLDALEHEIRDAKKSLLSGVKNIDEARCMDIIYTLRNNLPDSIKEARLILAQRDAIMNDAIEEGSRIIDDAKTRASQMLDETGIVQQAQAEAAQIIANEKNNAYNLYTDTCRHVDELLYNAEKDVYNMLNEIRETRRDLAESQRRE